MKIDTGSMRFAAEALIAARRAYADHPLRGYAMRVTDAESEYAEAVDPEDLLELLDMLEAKR